MSKNNKINMPSSGAGITRYFDEVKTRFELRPEYVIVLAALIVIVVILLHVQG